MNVERFPLGTMETNCYIIDDGQNCLLIDPADSADFILETLLRKKFKLTGILATHGHFDHIMAVGEIQSSCDVPFYIHENDCFLVGRLNETAKYFLGFNPHVLNPKSVEFLKKGKMKIGNFKFEIIETPGHTPGSCCFYFHDDKILFTGDTLFKDGIGRYDFSYSSKVDLDKSLKKLFRLPEEAVIYPGHTEEITIGGW